jgi:hypothetical protein
MAAFGASGIRYFQGGLSARGKERDYAVAF